MTSAILDTTVVIHLYRKNPSALAWIVEQTGTFSITPVTWLEAMVGAPNKQAQTDLLNLLDSFEIIYLVDEDQKWAMHQMKALKFSQGVGIMDCFNASISFRLKVPIYTHNQRDFLKLLPPELVVKPY